MLLVFAHPDDESFSCAGTIAKYVKAGWHVDLICATRGEVGDTGPFGDVSEEELGKIRQKEVERAGTLLGISSITFLGYKDGTLSGLNSGELEDVIYKKMEETVPDCVITFDTTGLSNHPDHIKMCYATTFAFQKYAYWIRGQFEGKQDFTEEQEPKLYYVCMPVTITEYLKKKKVIPSESFGKPRRGTDDKFITTVIGIRGYQMIKKKALLLHVSQKADVGRFLSFWKNPLIRHEYYILRLHGIREVFMGKTDAISSEL